MQLDEFIQRVQSLYSKGVHSKDTRLTSRHIYSAGCTARDTVLGQQSDRNQSISQWSYQPICIDLVMAAPNECNIYVPKSCRLLRSKYKIPQIIVSKNKPLIQSFSTLDGGQDLYKTSFSTRKYASGNKYTADAFRYYIFGEYIYVTIAKELKGVLLSAAFSSPIEAYLYPSLCGCNDGCKDIMKMEFPLDGDLIRNVITITANELVFLFKQMTEDKSNDASDDAGASGTMIHEPTNQNQQDGN